MRCEPVNALNEVNVVDIRCDIFATCVNAVCCMFPALKCECESPLYFFIDRRSQVGSQLFG